MSETAPPYNYVYQPLPAVPDWVGHKDPPIYAVAGPDANDVSHWYGKKTHGITKSEAERIARDMNYHWRRKEPGAHG